MSICTFLTVSGFIAGFVSGIAYYRYLRLELEIQKRQLIKADAWKTWGVDRRNDKRSPKEQPK